MKPPTNQTLLLDLVENNVLNNYILDLADFSINTTPDEVILTIDLPSERVDQQNPEFLILCISDDPYMINAGDWTNLGYGRLRIEMRNPKRKQSDKIQFSCKGNELKMELLSPERKMPNAHDYARLSLF